MDKSNLKRTFTSCALQNLKVLWNKDLVLCVIILLGLKKKMSGLFIQGANLGPVVRKVDNFIQRIVIFSIAEEKALKLITPKILSSHRLKSVFKLKKVTFYLCYNG